MTGAEYLSFLGASIILALTPGPDTFLMLKFGTHHVRTGLIYTAAVTLGVIVWAVLALTGVAVLLEQFPGVRTGLTWIGGSYLTYLGISALYQVKRSRKGRNRSACPFNY
ncbi:LysE family translocator [Arthrobacter sp. Sr33]